MSIQQAAQAAVAVFPATPIRTRSGLYSLPVVMVAIAGPQSSWIADQPGDRVGTCPGCYGPNCAGMTSWGLWQIHNSTQPFLTQVTGSSDPCTWARWLYDPVNNARAAYYLYRAQGLQRAWGGDSTWDTDAVEAALPQAQAAVAAAGGTVGTSGITGTPGGPVPRPAWLLWAGAGALAYLVLADL